MKNWQLLLCIALLFSVNLFANDTNYCVKSNSKNAAKVIATSQCYGPQGWIFDLGGQFTMVDFTYPFGLDVSTGVNTKITYQRPKSFYGQLRSILNLGMGLDLFIGTLDYAEWYGEYVSGYCFGIKQHWTITPYGGIGVDALNQRATAYGIPIVFNKYNQTYYLLFGFEARYSMEKWYFALQADGLPIAQQYCTLVVYDKTTFKLKPGIGAAVRLSAARRLGKHFWLELTPYYRYFPFGKTNTAYGPTRELSQVGFFLNLRYAI